MAEGIAVEGLRLVFANLPTAVANGNDLEARAHMMSAAAMGATAFQKGLGAIHALSHPVGALYNTHLGTTNGVFMPYVLAFNRPAIEDKIERLAGFLEIDGGFDGVLAAVLDLRQRTGIPHSLSALGVDDSKAALIVEMSLVDPTAGGNPVPLTQAGSQKLFDAALAGDVAAAAS
jgi:alcohol dehydrogenase